MKYYQLKAIGKKKNKNLVKFRIGKRRRKRERMTKHILCFIFNIVVIIQGLNIQNKQDLLQKFVFSTSQLVDLPFNRICSNTKELNNIIPIDGNQNMFYLNSDLCGLIILKINNKGQFEQMKVYPEINNVVLVKMKKDDQTLWISDSNMHISIYNTANPTMLFLINQFSSNKPTYQINFSKDNKQSFLIQGGDQISIYNIEKQDISLLQQLQSPKNPQQVLVSSNNKVMIIAGYNIQFYQIQNVYEPSSPYQFKSNYLLTNNDDTQFIEIIEDKYLYSWGLRTGLSQFNIETCLQTGICDQSNVIELYSQKDLISSSAQVFLTSDKNYFITILNTQGIYILDISERKGFPIFQIINVNQIVNYMVLNQDESLLLLISDKVISVFQRIQPNLNLDTPNILNLYQNYLYPLQQNQQINQSWNCYSGDNILIATQNQNGVYFLSINSSSKHLEVIQKIDLNAQQSIHEVKILNDKQYFIISYGEGILQFYKQTNNFQNIQQLSVFTSPILNSEMNCIKQTKDGNTLFIASGYAGVIVVDITDILNPTFLTSITYDFSKKEINASAQKLYIGQDEKLLYCSYRYLGFVIYDIKDVHKPLQVNIVYTKGGEDIILTSDWKNILSIDRFYGINIYSIEKNPNQPVWISSVKTEGLSLHLKLLQQDKFILTTSLQRGQLYLIDFRDRNNPSVLQSLQQEDSNNYAFDVCLAEDEQTSYIITPQGIVQIPLINQLIFHTDIIWLQELKESFQQQKVSMNPPNSQSKVILQVGMNIQILLSSIYPQNQIMLMGALYNDNQLIKELPQWITLSQNEFSAALYISKKALNQREIQDLVDQTESDKQAILIKEIQLIFKFSERINAQDFINNSLGITSDISLQIFNDCKKKKIIAQSRYLNEKIASTYLEDSNQGDLVYPPDVLESIKYVLRNKIIHYPVTLYIQNSLFINIQSRGQVINSFSDSVSVKLTINRKQAKFVEQNYPGILIALNEQQNCILLEGDLDEINKILTIGIKIATRAEISIIQVMMEVNDSINYTVIKKFYANQSTVISVNQQPYLNPNFSLQSDFDKKYLEGSVAILEQFTYKINYLLFLDDDSQDLHFVAYIKDESGDYKQLSSGYWLEFDSSSRQLSGTPPYNFWYKNIELKIVASDGYEEVLDYLQICVNRIPISVLIVLLLQILLPILTFVLIWKCNSKIYNICYKKNHETSLIKVKSGKLIEIQIPLIKRDIQIAKNLWMKYFKSTSKDEFIQTINYFKQKQVEKRLYEKYMKYYQSNQPVQTCHSDQILLETQQKTLQSQQNINSSYKQSGYSQFSNSLQKNIKNMSSNYFSLTLNQETSIKYEENLSLKLNVERSPKSKRMKDSNQQSKLIKQITLNEINQKKKSRTLSRKSQNSIKFENSFLQKSGHINGKYIVNQVLDHYLMQKKSKINQDIVVSLSNVDSKLSRCIIGLSAFSIAKLDVTTNKIIEFLKEKATYYYTPQDWYKRYVNIIPCFDKVQTLTFPIIEINDEILQKDLNIFSCDSNDDLITEQNGLNTEATHVPYFLPLIKDLIIAISYGFTFDKFTFIPRPIGECLQINAQNIKCIESYTLSTSTSCQCFKKIFDKQYVKKELIENSKLNSWITSVDIINNTILISGIPQNKDCGKYMLKIIDRLGYTIKRIHIEVQYNQEFSSKLSQLLNLKQSNHPNIDAVAIEFEENNPKKTPNQNQTHSNSYNNFTRIYAKDDSVVL